MAGHDIRKVTGSDNTKTVIGWDIGCGASVAWIRRCEKETLSDKKVVATQRRSEGDIMLDNDIENKNYKAVMVWGIDDEDSVAFIKPLTEWYGKAVPLYLHKSRDTQVQVSVVAKSRSGVITIGYDAGEMREHAIHFMRSPESWERMSSTGVTYREHMSDYIRGMSEAILQNSSNRCGVMRHVMLQDDNGVAHWQKDEVLLVVSRPSSITWKGKKMRRQYAELISEATGISNVIVTEESRAAVFILLDIYNLQEEINLQGGALVLDFGSYTADATYLLPEEGSVNICWELGDAQVERAMLEYIQQSDRWKKALQMPQKEMAGKGFLLEMIVVMQFSS